MVSPADAQPGAAAPELDEEDLLARLRAGDDAAYETLVRSYGGRMLAAARRILGREEDAQEAVQEAFLSAFRAVDRFHGQSRIGTWLHRIAINAALMKLRRNEHRRERAVEDLLPAWNEDGHFARLPEPWSEPADDDLLRDEAREVVRTKIAELPDPYRIALTLRDIEGLSNEELAGTLGVSVNAAKIRVHRARQALRTLLDPYMSGENG
jgi:RNA polymerase sigma-70 factor (ECF subfamily)